MIANAFFVRHRSEFKALGSWIKDCSFNACQYRPDHPGFRSINLFDGDVAVGRIVCISPHLFDEVLHIVRLNQRVEAA